MTYLDKLVARRILESVLRVLIDQCQDFEREHAQDPDHGLGEVIAEQFQAIPDAATILAQVKGNLDDVLAHIVEQRVYRAMKACSSAEFWDGIAELLK